MKKEKGTLCICICIWVDSFTPPWSSAFSTLQNLLSHVKMADIGTPARLPHFASQSGDDRSQGYL
jgi:hypothetical protein